MKGLKEMASKLIASRESSIVIVGDYDCDGATATAVMKRGLDALGFKIDFVIPDRLIDGYGLSPSIARKVHASHAPDIIITVDNGILSFAGVDQARELGMKVFVTDHHLPSDTGAVPNAEGVINPRQQGCDFPGKNIAGCAVAWYLVAEVAKQLKSRFNPDTLLPLVAVGTIADVVQLDSYNRAIVDKGMKMIRDGKCQIGIKALASVSKKDLSILNTTDVAFYLGPRINAAGRLASMTTGINLLLTDDAAQAEYLANELQGINEQRKDLDSTTVEEAMAMIKDLPASASCVTLFNKDWHEGIVGIVAGKIKEQVNRPVFVFTLNHEGKIKGSGRSVPGVHLKHTIDEIAAAIPDEIAAYGGHAAAAGITLCGSSIDAFTSQLEKSIQASGVTFEEKVVMSDGLLDAKDITRDLIDEIYASVWGAGCPEPVFSARMMVLKADWVGADKTHCRLELGTGDGSVIGMWFRCPHEIFAGDYLDINYRLNLNSWKGAYYPQILIDGDSSLPSRGLTFSLAEPGDAPAPSSLKPSNTSSPAPAAAENAEMSLSPKRRAMPIRSRRPSA